ncbi:uncharacterized protein MONBRDRAFT_23213 [Monosiga brevicollis MX1]|uniref:Transcription factor IIIC subunit 5 HTH domain-containing protein n=1 Tax=Monosiga brevicollis TaxID=81824 RepID=A9URI1_MONBE|nr:uncharacterized protein MONBRDRAFT_23213 [Monosiga brevicollis MX1]EDQ92247.1 predicted protein [Monosiga brevicollis MX1]|eukprot:XP_001743533.1 hypothetical protein [Monosiga brevicollis MX1]
MTCRRPGACALVLAVLIDCLIRNAINALGGLSAVAEAALSGDDKAKLTLALRPDDPYAHPLAATRSPNHHLLLKVTRRRNAPLSAASDVRVDPVGVVEAKFEFKEPADFQYIPGLPPANQPLFQPPRPEDDILHPGWLEAEVENDMVPPVFCPAQPKNTYNFQENPIKGRVTIEQRHVRKTQQKPGQVHFDIETVPAEPAMELSPTELTDATRAAAYERLKELFKRQPIWPLKGITEELQHDVDHSTMGWLVKVPLRSVAYNFKSGPWRSLHIAYGYDPRADPKAHKFQTVDWRSQRNNHNAIAAKRSSLARATGQAAIAQGNDSHMFVLLHAGTGVDHVSSLSLTSCSCLCHYMICDLHDEDIQALVQKRPLRSKCHRQDFLRLMSERCSCRYQTGGSNQASSQVCDGS